MRHRSFIALGVLAMASATSACSSGSGDSEGALAPGAGEAMSRGVITSLSVAREDNKDVDRFMTHHPIRVNMTIKPTGPVADHVISMGLVEKVAPGAPRDKVRTCLLGTMEASYGVVEGQEASEVSLSRDLVVSPDCLAGASDDATFNLWVGIDAKGAQGDELAQGGEGAQGATDRLGTQFFNEERIDLSGLSRNDACAGSDGKPGCVIDINVTRSEGYNVAVDELSPLSHVGVMTPSCSVDFAAPLAAMSGRIRLFGAASHTGSVKGEEARNALVSEDGQAQPIELRYSLCPRGEAAEDGSAPCATGTDYAPLFVGAPGSGKDLRDFVTVDRLVNAEPHVFNHGVFVAPESQACSHITSDWSKYATYNLKVCETAPKAERRNGGDEAADNCAVEPIELVVKAPSRATNASAWQLYKEYSTETGNSVVNVGASFGTDNNLNLNGATTHSWATAGVGGWFSFDLFNVWADGAAYVPIVGSYADAGIDVLGARLWHYHQELAEIHLEANPQYGRQACVGYDYTILDLGLTISACAKGTVGLQAKLDVAAKDGNEGPPFETSGKIGKANALVKPWASLQLVAEASADIGVTRGGVSGTMTLLNTSLPAKGNLTWGLTNFDPPTLTVAADVSLDLNIETLSGNIHAWVEQGHPDWCDADCWLFDCGYPCWGWSTVWDDDLISWGGYAWSWNLYSAGGTMTLGDGPGVCSHDVCTMGDTLDASCSPCAAAVCAADSYCCDALWDTACVDLVGSVCETSCQ
jgi:hypothetical protein